MVTFTATGSDSKTYTASKASVTFAAGKYYQSTLKMAWDLSAYYSKMVECGCDNLEDKCANGANPQSPFTKQVLTAAQAIALAQAKAAETSSNCAVFYDSGGFTEIKFAKNDGTTGSAIFYYPAVNKGLSGYRGFYVNK